MGAMDVELAEIRDFLAAARAVRPTAPRCWADCRAGARCATRAAAVSCSMWATAGEGLYVVRSGAVEVRDETGDLIERVGTGEAFGMSSLLEHRPTRYRCTAIEDTLLLVLEPELFEELSREHMPDFATFYAASHHARLSRAIGNLQRADVGRHRAGHPDRRPGHPRARHHRPRRHDRPRPPPPCRGPASRASWWSADGTCTAS